MLSSFPPDASHILLSATDIRLTVIIFLFLAPGVFTLILMNRCCSLSLVSFSGMESEVEVRTLLLMGQAEKEKHLSTFEPPDLQ